MVPYAGYEMPVQYQGIIAEAKAVRESAGMFDVSHMARLEFTGSRTAEFLDWITTNDVAALSDGGGHYSLLPNDQGGCVDDIIVYRLTSDRFKMVVNAANHAKDVAWIESQNRFDVEMRDDTASTTMIAVQGPAAVDRLAAICSAPNALQSAPLFGVVEAEFGGVACFAARSGYTGEDGFELVCSDQDGPKLWSVLLELGVVPCGLGSRDVLRVEAGLPLYGHELGDDISPIEAGLGWVVSKTKSFVGSELINQVRAEGPRRKLHGIVMETKRIPNPGAQVGVNGKCAGEVSSGVYSPALDRGIGFAFVDAALKIGQPAEIELRGKLEPCTIASKRFLKRG